MPIKFVYVVTSTPADIYLEQTFISMYSLLRHDSEAHIVLLTDNLTDGTLTGARSKILSLVKEKIVVDFDDSVSNMRRSRYLKTSMRNLIDGDLLYIDGDTVINAPLGDIEQFDCEIGAVEDAHRKLDVHYGKEKLARHAKIIDCDFSGEEYYFNGGVLYVKDNENTRRFFSKWHENWKFSSSKGLNLDMPALIKTDIEMGHMIKRIPGEWNCQVMYGFNYFSNARIIHYFASRYSKDNGGMLYAFMDNGVFSDFKTTYDVSENLLDMIDNPLKQFAPCVEMIGNTDVDIINTHVYKLVRLTYLRFPKVFNALQSILFKINKIKKKNE